MGIGQSIINILVDMTKRIIYRYISIIFIILTTLPFVNGYFGVRITFVELAIVLISVILYPNAFLNKITLLSLLYILILMLYFLLGNPFYYFVDTVGEVLVILSFLSISNVYNYNKDDDGMVLITIVGISIIAITLISTIRLLNIDPMVVRSMASRLLNEDYYTDLNKQGVAGYGLMSLSPLLIPLIVYNFKNIKNRYSKILIILFIVILYYAVINSNLATAIIFLNLLLIISIIISKNKGKNYFVLIIAFMMAMVITVIDFTGFLVIVRDLFDSDFIRSKIDDIITTLQYGYMTGQVGDRTDLYSVSINTFLNNPVVPDIKELKIGGHAYLIDKFAVIGLFGMIPYVMFIYYCFERIYKQIKDEARIYYIVSIVGMIMLMFVKNISELEFYLYSLVYMQGLTKLVDYKKSGYLKNSVI